MVWSWLQLQEELCRCDRGVMHINLSRKLTTVKLLFLSLALRRASTEAEANPLVFPAISIISESAWGFGKDS
jgi:hypothetical protein